MSEKKSKPMSIVKVANTELFLDSQLMTAGASQSRILEKYEKNPDSLKSMAIFAKVIYAFLVGFLTIMPLITYFQILEYLGGGVVPFEIILFTGSLLFGVFFGMQLGYLLMGGMLFSAALMTGETFKWLETLPISLEKLQKISYKLVIRSVNAILIVIVFLFPIVFLIGGLNIPVFLLSIGVSMVNALFYVSIIVFVGRSLSRILTDSAAQTKKKTAVRLLYMGSYLILIFGLMIVLQVVISSIDDLFILFATSEHSSLINIILSVIPYPFAPAYFILLWTAPTQVPIELWFTSSAGLAILVLLTRRMYKGALKALKNITSSEGEKTIEVAIEDVVVEVTISTPFKAFLKKDLVTATRDLTMLMYLVMPIIYPLIMFASIGSGMGEGGSLIEAVWEVLVFLLMYTPMMAGFLVAGLLNVEESGATILASLPVVHRDQAKAKIFLMVLIMMLSFVPPLIIFLPNAEFLTFLGVVLSFLPLICSMPLFMFAMKVRLFGKMKYKYVLEELHIEYKIAKWITMVFTQIGILFGIYYLSFQLLLIGLVVMEIGMLSIGIATLIGLYFAINKMFPKIK